MARHTTRERSFVETMYRRNNNAIYLLYTLLFLLACGAAIAPMFSFYFPSVAVGEQLYHVQEFLAGRIPYRDFFTRNYIAYLFPLSLYFLFVPISSTSVWALALILHGLTSLGIAISCYLISRSWNMFFLGLLTACTAGWCWNWNGHGLYVQSIYLPLFSFWIVFMIAGIQSRTADCWYLAAVLLGVLLLFDPNLSVFMAASLSTVLLCKKKETSLPRPVIVICLLVLSAIPYALFLLWLEQQIALQGFVFQTYFYPKNYLISIRESVWWRFIAWGPYGEPMLSICGYLGLLGVLRRPSLTLRYFLLFLFLCCFAFLFAADLPGRQYLLLFMPPLVICAITGYWQLKQNSSFISLIVLLPLLAAIGIPLFRPLLIWQTTLSPFIPADERALHEAARQINNRASPKQTLLVVGPASLYVMTNKLSPFKDASLETVTGTSSQSTELSHGIVSEMAISFRTFLEEDPPDYIVYYYVHEVQCQNNSIYCRYSFFDTSKPSLQYNRDFRQAVALTYLKSKIQDDYHRVAANEWERDGYELYELRPESSVNTVEY